MQKTLTLLALILLPGLALADQASRQPPPAAIGIDDPGQAAGPPAPSACIEACDEDRDSFGKRMVAEQVVAATLYLDNDLFSSTDDDRDYTGGFAVAFSGAVATNHPFSIDRWLGGVNAFSRADRISGDGDFTMNSCELGITVFTPDDIANPAPISDDRPYSGLTYISNTRQKVHEQTRTSWVSTLTVGALGLGIATEAQNAIHRAIGATEAAGWGNQISDGGEPTFRYALSRLKHFDTGLPNLQITGSTGLGVGYLSDLSTAVGMRWGRLRTPWWSLDEDSGKYGAKAHAELPTSRRLDEFYLIAGVGAQARLYNAFLQGQFRDSAVTVDADNIRPLVYEGWLGAAFEFDFGLRLSYIVRYQSSELKSGIGDRSYKYGALVATQRF